MILNFAQLHGSKTLPTSLQPLDLSQYIRIIFLLALFNFLCWLSDNLHHRHRPCFDRSFSLFLCQIFHQLRWYFLAIVAKCAFELAYSFFKPCIFPYQIIESRLLRIQSVADHLVTLLQKLDEFEPLFVRQLVELLLAQGFGHVQLHGVFLAIKFFNVQPKRLLNLFFIHYDLLPRVQSGDVIVSRSRPVVARVHCSIRRRHGHMT